MRIIYTLSIKYGCGGFSKMSDLLESLCLTSNLSRKISDEVVLYCDRRSHQLIKNFNYNFGFTEIIETLDDCPYYTTNQWAFCKIYVYSLQNKPFIHLDIDAFIWKDLKPDIFTSRFLFQNKEDTSHEMRPFYIKAWEISKSHNIVPVDITLPETAYNMGIFGVFRKEDLGIIREYYELVLQYIKNEQSMPEIKTNGQNSMMFEQLFISSVLEKNRVPEDDISFTMDKDGYLLPGFDYSHYLSFMKKDIEIIRMIRHLIIKYKK
jgi:hypothetical protein